MPFDRWSIDLCTKRVRFVFEVRKCALVGSLYKRKISCPYILMPGAVQREEHFLVVEGALRWARAIPRCLVLRRAHGFLPRPASAEDGYHRLGGVLFALITIAVSWCAVHLLVKIPMVTSGQLAAQLHSWFSCVTYQTNLLTRQLTSALSQFLRTGDFLAQPDIAYDYGTLYSRGNLATTPVIDANQADGHCPPRLHSIHI